MVSTIHKTPIANHTVLIERSTKQIATAATKIKATHIEMELRETTKTLKAESIGKPTNFTDQ